MSPAGDGFLFLVIGAFAALGAVRGGLVSATIWLALGVGTLAGFVIGLPLAAALDADKVATFAVVGGALFSATLFGTRLSQYEQWLDTRIPDARCSLIDRTAGALIGSVFGASLAWVFVIVLSAAPGAEQFHTQLRSSAVAQTLLSYGPPAGPSTRVLARSGFFAALDGPIVTIDVPDGNSTEVAAVRQATDSVLRIEGASGCGASIGSGWVAAPDLVVTNAHVVAGHQPGATSVIAINGSQRRGAKVVSFDPIGDVAVLQVDNLNLRALTMNSAPPEGAPGAIIGNTVAGATIAAARYDFLTDWTGDDIYGAPAPEHPIVVFRAEVRPGNSGGPLVDEQGHVMATVYASTVGQAIDGGYGVPNTVVAQALAAATDAPVDTGPCAEDESQIAPPAVGAP